MILFYIKEAFKGIGRAKSSFILSFLSSALAVLLINITLFTLEFSNNFQKQLKDKVTINLILDDSLPQAAVQSLRDSINNKRFAKTIQYLNKDDAAKKFIQETGEDFRKILDYNPLPASFLVVLRDEYLVQDSLDVLVRSLKSIDGIDEVVFQKDIASNLLTSINKAKIYIYSISAMLLLVSLYLVYSSVKIITNQKTIELDAMKLVGAKLSTIKIPIILLAAFIGILASITACGLFISFLMYLDNVIYKVGNYPMYILTSFIIGPLIGILAAIVALRKISLKI
jgi:cell division transport system permease protein